MITKPNTKATTHVPGYPVRDDSGGDRKTPTKPIGMLEIVKVVREHHPLIPGREGRESIGQIVDDYLADTALEGHEVQSFSMEISKDYWRALADHVQAAEAEKRGG